MAVKNDVLIDRIEKQYNVKLNIYYLGEWGLFCSIKKSGGVEEVTKIADYDMSFTQQIKLQRTFLLEGIHILLKPAKIMKTKVKMSKEGVKEEVKIAKKIQQMKRTMKLKDIATTLNTSIGYVQTRTKEDYIPKLLEKEGI
jgi:hypothetical protein